MPPRIVESFPRAVREIENVWIPLSDGCRLAARVWLPADAENAPVPAILEYIPYRKRDVTRGRDEPMHAWFAGHGYAAVRVDVRGSGDSGGVLTDEYTARELDDAVEVIAWLAARPWCTGRVGMMGISWGGFNSLQVAALRPPALGAIVTLCSTDDRYADDAHYMGGCLLNENLTWGSVLLHCNAYPPDPEITGDAWRDEWLRRLESTPLFPAIWLGHQTRDDYWRHGSVCEDYARIACPVYAIGGWADGYSNAVPRLLAGLSVPRKGLIGPWAHAFPHDAIPGPSIGFLQETLRWWDHWLKDRDTGLLDEPMLRVWMQDSVEPRPTHDERPGRWVAERTWPSPRIVARQLVLDVGTLADTASGETALDVQSPQTTGLGAGEWCAFGVDGEMPTDQRIDDGKSLIFDGAPLAERLEILGAPVVELELCSDRPSAFVAVRLSDVAPDGSAIRVSYGLLNLTHRNGHERVEPLVPGERCRVRVQLNDVAHAFPAGHRMRVAISNAYWPIAWPSPEPARLTLFAGASTLTLPVRPPDPADEALRAFEPPEQAPRSDHQSLLRSRLVRKFERDLASDETVFTIYTDGSDSDGASLVHIRAIDLEVGFSILRRYRIGDRDPLSARAEVVQRAVLRRGAWSVRIESHVRMHATAGEFRLAAVLEAFEAGASVFRREWDHAVPRLGV